MDGRLAPTCSGAVKALSVLGSTGSIGTQTLELAEDPFSVVYPPGHPVPGKEVKPGDIEFENLLLLEDGHCLRDQALAACRLEGARRNAGFQGTSLHTLVQMVDNGLGLTMLPEMALDAGILTGTDVVARPLKAPNANREIALVWRKNSPRADEFKIGRAHV